MANENASPISAAKPPVSNPMAESTSHAATLKLKPVIRKPGEAPARPAAAALQPGKSETAPLDMLKGITQKLKGVTQAIPQQAILHKTGIIAEQDLTDAQKQASKSRTARISLSDAIGAAPVKNEAAPMKTIRIKRPVDLEAAPAAAPAAAAEPSVTQRKTLKIARPGGVSRPGVKIGKKPAAPVPAPAAEAAAEGDVPEIADLPEVPETAAAAPAPANGVPYSKVAMGLSVAVQFAACVAMGVLAYWLFEATELIFAF
jgi:hypothetical protein